MTFEEYAERASEFAVYPEESDYLFFALIEEVGEVCGVIAKRERGDDMPDFRERMLSELGDVLWVCSQHDFVRKNFVWADGVLRCDPLSNAEVMAIHAADGDAVRTLRCAVDIIVWLDSTPEAAAQANLEKLADRQERGVIQGDGDER